MQSRRSLLARIAAGVGLVGAGSAAGCVERPPDGRDGGPPAYAESLYDPMTVVSAPVPTRAFASYDLATLYERRSLFPDRFSETLDRADRSTEAVSVPELERATALGYWGYGSEEPTAGSAAGGGSLLVRGSFDPDALLERARSEVGGGATVESAGRVQGLDLYVLQSEREQAGSVALGLGERRVVAGGTARVDATGEDAARATVESERAGYADTSDTAGRLLETTGDPTAVVGVEFDAERYAPDSLEGVPARESVAAVVGGLRGVGSAMTLGEGAVTRTLVGVYAEGERPERADVRALLDLARQGVATRSESIDVAAVQALIDDAEVDVDGRTVTVEVRRETGALFDGDAGADVAVMLAPGLAGYAGLLLGLGPGLGQDPADDVPTPPQATFDVAFDAGAGEVTVTHTGGDSFTEANTERLLVRSGDRPPVPWELPVSAGDGVTVPAESGDAVFVAWEPAEGDVVQIIAQFQVS